MDSHRWQRMQALFHEAVELAPNQRRPFLETACGQDRALVSQVLAMLEQDAQASSLLDDNLEQVAHRILQDDAPVALPKQVGPYRIREILGEGGMGVVYLAERADLGSLVALKLLRDAWLSPARRERFAAEQRTLAQLNHPSIARLYDADTLPDGTPFFVMEYVEGVPLTDYCRGDQCTIERRLRLFRAVCEAVQYAHSNAVIHRDLKPSNILVKPDGSIRLLDFGIAKQLESLDVPVDQTMTGLRLMTPAYAAPEQIRGERVGVQTDVYSLGVILYELLTGRLPFDLSNLSPGEAETVLLEHDPPRPSAAAQTASDPPSALGAVSWADLDVLCLTAMHKDAERRYRSVEALIRDIDHYLDAEPLEARPDTWRYRAGKFVRRNRRAVTATALGFAVIVGLVAFFTFRLAKARNAAVEAADRAQLVQHFMLNLFQGGDEAAGPADDLKVVALLDRGVQEAQSLNADPGMQAELYETLGSIYQKLGKFERADALLRQALEQRKSLFGADSPEVARSLVALGMLRSDQARLEEAEPLVRQGLDIARRRLPPNHPDVGRATAALGTILENRGVYDQSIQVLEEAVRLQSAPGTPAADLAATLSELANSQFYAGHYDISDAINQRVLVMDRQLYGERHPHVANDLINLAEIQFEQGHFAKAEQYQRQALAITQTFYGTDNPETASAMTILGRILVSEKRPAEAAEMLRQALTIQEHVYGNVHPRVASALNELGRVAQQQGKLDEAEADFRRMADIYKQVYAGKHYYIGVADSNLAGVYLDEKKYKQGEGLFREALRIYASTLPPEHQLVAIAQVRLGGALLLEHRYKEAEPESLSGYELLKKQTSPPARWFNQARSDLAEEYDGLKQPQQAARFRAELTAASSQPSSQPARN